MRSIVLILLVSSTACTPVRPYQRGALQSRLMSTNLGSAEAQVEAHVKAAREHSVGASNQESSSCGCN